MKKFYLLAIVTVGILFTGCEDDSTISSGKHKGHEFVDLGLTVKWATCNVGADNPWDLGDFFAWGETKPKTEFTRDTYKWYESGEGWKKYCSTDNKFFLDATDDAATANWGGNWRMPTYGELQELVTNCTWTETIQKGILGYNVRGANGNSIFLPKTNDNTVDYLNGCGYWSCVLDQEYDDPEYSCAYYLDIEEDINLKGECRWCYSFWRPYGCLVRPVYP